VKTATRCPFLKLCGLPLRSMFSQYLPFFKMSSNTDTKGVNGQSGDFKAATAENLKAWDTIADWWEHKQSEAGADGNDMFTQCLLPQVEQLADWQEGQTVLDLGAGSGIICRMFAKKGARVTGLDFSRSMLEKARKRAADDGVTVTYDFIDLMDPQNMAEYASKHPEYVHGV